jgi:hypothetical protein
MDGGSNGFDRLENFNRLKNLDKLLENKTAIDFNAFIDRIKNDEIDIYNINII